MSLQHIAPREFSRPFLCQNTTPANISLIIPAWNETLAGEELLYRPTWTIIKKVRDVISAILYQRYEIVDADPKEQYKETLPLVTDAIIQFVIKNWNGELLVAGQTYNDASHLREYLVIVLDI